MIYSTLTNMNQYERHRSNLPWEFYVVNEIKNRLSSDTGLKKEGRVPIANFHRLDVFSVSGVVFCLHVVLY